MNTAEYSMYHMIIIQLDDDLLKHLSFDQDSCLRRDCNRCFDISNEHLFFDV